MDLRCLDLSFQHSTLCYKIISLLNKLYEKFVQRKRGVPVISKNFSILSMRFLEFRFVSFLLNSKLHGKTIKQLDFLNSLSREVFKSIRVYFSTVVLFTKLADNQLSVSTNPSRSNLITPRDYVIGIILRLSSRIMPDSSYEMKKKKKSPV